MRSQDHPNSVVHTVDPRLARDVLARSPHEPAAEESAYGQSRDIMARKSMHRTLPSNEPELRYDLCDTQKEARHPQGVEERFAVHIPMEYHSKHHRRKYDGSNGNRIVG